MKDSFVLLFELRALCDLCGEISVSTLVAALPHWVSPRLVGEVAQDMLIASG
jgi:hypothetical protein